MTRRILLEDLLGSPTEVQRFCDVLSSDGVAAIPTETFYALAANPRSSKAVARVFELKGRNAEKALPVLFADPEQLKQLKIENPAGLERFLAIWPAALTVIFPTSSPLSCAGGDASLAVRMPAREDLRELLRLAGPLTGTSANISGRPPLSDPNEVEIAFGGALDLIVDGGPTPGMRPSTLVDARFDPPRVLRRGAYPWQESG
jgi:L-threonylcarbamoyladenylate synthase